jgi:hypothetical protein
LPAKDRHHDIVLQALIKDGWKITDEQVKVIVGDRYLFIDIEAQKISDNAIILVEVKELDSTTAQIEALATAIGKYFLYRAALDDAEIATPLYLAVSENSYQGILSEKIGKLSITEGKIKLVVFDPINEEIIRWLP